MTFFGFDPSHFKRRSCLGVGTAVKEDLVRVVRFFGSCCKRSRGTGRSAQLNHTVREISNQETHSQHLPQNTHAIWDLYPVLLYSRLPIKCKRDYTLLCQSSFATHDTLIAVNYQKWQLSIWWLVRAESWHPQPMVMKPPWRKCSLNSDVTASLYSTLCWRDFNRPL